MKLIVIGRNPQEATLLINSDYVSGYHAELILLDNGDMYLVDKSTNGTILNGVRMTPGKEYQVHRGDNVIIADTPLNWNEVPDIVIPSNVKKIISIGSHYTNNIKLSGINVSRFHATIRQLTDGKWEICDHSKNGTTINGNRIPKDRYVRIKAKDQISCAGIPVTNPIPSGNSRFLKVSGITAICILAMAGIVFGLYKLAGGSTSVVRKYQDSVVFLYCTYHFHVSCGTLDLTDLPDPTSESPYTGNYTSLLYEDFVLNSNGIEEYDGANYNYLTATGFLIGENGYIATNRHVAKPWEAEKYSSASNVTYKDLAEDYYKALLTLLYEDGFTQALPYISQIKVEGVLDNVYIVKNGDYFDSRNAFKCVEVACGPSLDEDLAIFKSKNGVPAKSTYIPLDKIAKQSVEPLQDIITIGFPYGLDLQKGWEKNPLYANIVAGHISKDVDKYSFCFNAPSYQGASGSPIFDKKGNLVGIVNAKMPDAGFVFAVKSEFLDRLIKSEDIK